MKCTPRLALLTVAATLALGAQASAQSELVPFGGQNYASPYHVAGEPGSPSRVYVVEAAGRIRVVVDGVTQGGSFLDINTDVCDGGEGRGRVRDVLDGARSGLRDHRALLRLLHPRCGRQHDLVIREFQRTADPNDVDEATGRDVLVIPHPDAEEPQRRPAPVRPRRAPVHLDRRRGEHPSARAEPDHPAGEAAADRSGRPPGPLQYSIPAENPFADGAGPNADEIYSYGLRNPYRFSFDRLDGRPDVADVGQAEWEEIDFVSDGGGRGANFGWRCFEGTRRRHHRRTCAPPLVNSHPARSPVPEPSRQAAPRSTAASSSGTPLCPPCSAATSTRTASARSRRSAPSPSSPAGPAETPTRG